MTSKQLSSSENYSLICNINNGAFGIVSKIKIKETGEILALKQINLSNKSEEDRKTLLIKAEQEYQILSLKMKNVVQSYGSHWDEASKTFFLSMDFFPQNLYQYIQSKYEQRKKELSFYEFLPFFQNILTGF